MEAIIGLNEQKEEPEVRPISNKKDQEKHKVGKREHSFKKANDDFPTSRGSSDKRDIISVEASSSLDSDDRL